MIPDSVRLTIPTIRSVKRQAEGFAIYALLTLIVAYESVVEKSES